MHQDSIDADEKQFRLMIALKKAQQGGELVGDRFIIDRERVKLFEPNRCKHGVTKIIKGERMVALIAVRYAWKQIRPCPF